MRNYHPLQGYLSSQSPGADVEAALRELLTQYKIDESLEIISKMASTPLGSMRPSLLALVVRVLLESETDDRFKVLNTKTLEVCCDLAACLQSSPTAAFGVPVSNDALSYNHRVAYQQFPDQEETRYVPRSLVIYRQIAPGVLENKDFDFERRFAETYGLTIDNVWNIGYALTQWANAHPGSTFDPNSLQDDLNLEEMDDGVYRKFLGIYSCDFDVFRSMLSSPVEGQRHFEPYNLNPFRKYPMLTLPNGKHILPIPMYLLRRITHGLYYDLIDLDRRAYINVVGRSFREYVWKMLGELSPSESIAQLKNGPFAVISGNKSVLIECITRPFGALSRATGERSHLSDDLGRPGGIVDIVKRLQDIQESTNDGTSSHVSIRDKKIFGVIVALEDFYLANGRLIRDVVDTQLGLQGRPQLSADIQMTHIGGLEDALTFIPSSDTHFVDLIAKKANQPKYQGFEMGEYVRHQALLERGENDNDLTPELLARAAKDYLCAD